MKQIPVIRQIRLSRYRIPFQNIGSDLGFAMGPFYEPGSLGFRPVLGIRIETDAGITGEYMSIAPATFEQILMFAPYLIGQVCLGKGTFL